MYAGQANIAKMTPLQQQFDVVRTVRIRMWYTYVRPTAGNSARPSASESASSTPRFNFHFGSYEDMKISSLR